MIFVYSQGIKAAFYLVSHLLGCFTMRLGSLSFSLFAGISRCWPMPFDIAVCGGCF